MPTPPETELLHLTWRAGHRRHAGHPSGKRGSDLSWASGQHRCQFERTETSVPTSMLWAMVQSSPIL